MTKRFVSAAVRGARLLLPVRVFFGELVPRLGPRETKTFLFTKYASAIDPYIGYSQDAKKKPCNFARPFFLSVLLSCRNFHCYKRAMLLKDVVCIINRTIR